MQGSKGSWTRIVGMRKKTMRGMNKKLCNRKHHLHQSFVDTPEKHPIAGYNVVLSDFIYNRVTALWGLSGAQQECC